MRGQMFKAGAGLPGTARAALWGKAWVASPM